MQKLAGAAVLAAAFMMTAAAAQAHGYDRGEHRSWQNSSDTLVPYSKLSGAKVMDSRGYPVGTVTDLKLTPKGRVRDVDVRLTRWSGYGKVVEISARDMIHLQPRQAFTLEPDMLQSTLTYPQMRELPPVESP